MEAGTEDTIKGTTSPGTSQERPEASSPDAKRQRQMIEEVLYTRYYYIMSLWNIQRRVVPYLCVSNTCLTILGSLENTTLRSCKTICRRLPPRLASMML